MRHAAFALIYLSVLSGPVAAAEPEEARICYSPAQTRAAIAEHQLNDPFALLRDAARKARAEPLTSRLCKWGDHWVYEMTLLPRNGKVTRLYVNAADGSAMEKDR